jgi:hypothetical protein
MSIWASQGSRRQDESGNFITNVTEVYATVVTDINGQFIVNVGPFNFVEILEVVAVIVGQTLDAADNIVDKLTATVIQVTDTVIKGVVIQPQVIDVTTGVGEIAPIQRGGAGNNVKVKVTGRR